MAPFNLSACRGPSYSRPLRVFLYDHTALSTLATSAATSPFGTAAPPPWWATYVALAENPSSLGHGPNDDFEWPYALMQLRLPALLAARRDVALVATPADADTVMWLVWEYGLVQRTPAVEPGRSQRRAGPLRAHLPRAPAAPRRAASPAPPTPSPPRQCHASGHQLLEWEKRKGHVWGSCNAQRRLVTWLTSTERWQRNAG